VVPLLVMAAFWPAASGFSTLAAELQGPAAPRCRLARPPAPSLARPASPARAANADGFIQRWLILEPIRVPGQLTESAVRTAVEKDFPVPATPLPGDGQTLKIGDSELAWHAVDTVNYNVNLYHFAYALNKPTSNVLFWAVTVVNAPREEMVGCGSPSAVIDDGVSKR
jgi:hypothetical protein